MHNVEETSEGTPRGIPEGILGEISAGMLRDNHVLLNYYGSLKKLLKKFLQNLF